MIPRLMIGLYLIIVLSASCGESDGDLARSVPRPADLDRAEEVEVVRAVERAREAVLRSPDSAATWGRLGHVLLAHGWNAEAAEAYGRAADLEEDAFRWRYLRARALEGIDPDAALEALEEALDRRRDYPAAYVYHAHLLRMLDRPEEAREALRRLEELEPGNPFSALWLGEIDLERGRPEEARDHLREAVRLHPVQSEAHRALAQALMALGEREAAEPHARAAREPTRYPPIHDPLWRDVEMAGAARRDHVERGNLFLREGDPGRAADEFAKALEDDRRAPMLRMHLGLALLRAERYPQAVAALERAVEDATSEESELVPARIAMIHVNLGAAYGKMGEPERAEAQFRRALALDPRSPQAAANLALLYRREGRLDEAIELLSGHEDQPAVKRLLEQLRAERSERTGSEGDR